MLFSEFNVKFDPFNVWFVESLQCFDKHRGRTVRSVYGTVSLDLGLMDILGLSDQLSSLRLLCLIVLVNM
jgi:hypothetical protein